MSDYIGNRPAPVPLTFDQVQDAVNALPTLSFRNRIHNGCFRINQRVGVGASVSAGVLTYNADRWMGQGTAAATQGRFPSTAYGGLWAMNISMATAAAGSSVSFVQRIEAQDIADLVGKTVTLSFWAAAAVTTGGFSGQIYIGHPTTTADTFSAMTYPIGPTSFALDGTAARKSITFTVPANCDKGMEVVIRALKDGTAGTTLAMSIGGVQLEEGSKATPFERRPVGLELALCQRFYCKSYGQIYAPGTNTGLALGVEDRISAASTPHMCYFPVTMRTAPGTLVVYDTVGTSNSVLINGTTVNTPAAVDNASDKAFKVFASATAQTRISFHWTASAEL
jgi:hypothetical protein